MKFPIGAIKSYLLLCLSFVLTLQVNAQQTKNIVKEKTNIEALKGMAERWKKEDMEAKTIALKKAKEKGWSTVNLVRLDKQGNPVYYSNDNDIAAQTISTNQIQPGGALFLNLDGTQWNGSSFIIGLWEAFDTNACNDNEITSATPRLSHEQFPLRVNPKDDTPIDITIPIYGSHATHVCGTLIGDGTGNGADANNAKGMATKAEVWSYDITNNDSEICEYIIELTENDDYALVSNHSYGPSVGWTGTTWHGSLEAFENVSSDQRYAEGFGLYDFEARRWDEIAREAPYHLIVKSAGNHRTNNPPANGEEVTVNGQTYIYNDSLHPLGDGDVNNSKKGYDNISTTACAKNILTVGAINDLPGGYTSSGNVSFSDFTSWGPTDDGRIKPDIVANGVDLTSADCASDESYDTKSGTSMATPTVAGSSILLQEYYENRNGGGHFMLASTLKGLIIHTADDAGNDGPDYQYGWGVMNSKNAALLIKENSNFDNELIQEIDLENGEVYEERIQASGPIKITIAWTDAIGSFSLPVLDNSLKRLVNDLDLRISDGTTTFEPYILDFENPDLPATTGDNERDNVEQIFIENPDPSKTYTITISHKNSLRDGMQTFSMIRSGVQQCNPNPAVEASLLYHNKNTINDMIRTNDGGYILVGASYYSYDTGETLGTYGDKDFWVAKYDASRNLEWENFYGGTREDVANTIKQLADGSYIVAGYSFSFNGNVSSNNGSLDAWVIKIDAMGNLEWEENYGGSSADEAEDIVETTDGGFAILCRSGSDNFDVEDNYGSNDFWIIKTDNEGSIIWQHNYGGSMRDTPRKIIQTMDGGYLAIGSSQSNNGDISGHIGEVNESDSWIVKLDSDGNILWEQSLGGSYSDAATSVVETTEGDFVILNRTTSSDGHAGWSEGYGPIWLIKVSSAGYLLWGNRYKGSQGYSNGFSPREVSIANDGGYFLTGSGSSEYWGSGEFEIDVWIAKTTDTGTLVWEEGFGGSNTDVPIFLHENESGGVTVVASTVSTDGDVCTFEMEVPYLWFFEYEPNTNFCQTDYDALVALYNATDGSNWTTPWNLASPMHTWNGVVLNSDGCVSQLNLSDNNLTGTIPSEIGNLSSISYLDLQGNNLTGTIPAEIGNLQTLTLLYLRDNDLSGSIPSELGNLINLRSLYLSNNNLSGVLPSELGNLSSLNALHLSYNNLTGTIPSSFVNLSNIINLSLNNNQLSGSIPTLITQLDQLAYLDVSANEFSGCFDAALYDICFDFYQDFSENPYLPNGGDFNAFCADGLGSCSCETPSNIQLTIISGNVVKLDWDDVSGAVRYRIYFRPEGGNWIERLTGGAESYRFINGLTPNEKYEFKIKSLCTIENSAWSGIYLANTPSEVCDLPMNVEVVSVTSFQATLNWTPNAGDIKYKFRYKKESSNWNEVTTNLPGVYLTWLSPNTPYKYSIKTKCTNSWTQWSNNDSFKTLRRPFSGFRKVNVDETTAIAIYPNPAKNMLYIEQNIGSSELQLQDINGQILKTISSNASYIELPIDQYPNGVYFLRTISEDGKTILNKFVKTN